MPVYKDKQQGGWYFQHHYTTPSGKKASKKSKRFKTKSEALAAEHVYVSTLITNKSIDNVTFEQIYPEFLKWKEGTVKTSTCATYPSMWAHCETIKALKVKDLNVHKYNDFKDTLNATGLSTSRKNKIHKFVRQLVDYSKSHYDVKNDVFEKVSGFYDPNEIRTKNVDFMTYDEFCKFIKEVDDNKFHALFMVLYYQGLRIGEANGLTWEDIDFKKHTMQINKTVNTKIKGIPYMITSTKKSASDRILPIEEETENELKELKKWWKQYTNFEENWFLFGGVRPLGETAICTRKNEACNKAGVKQIRIHDFRHSCASFLINLGCQPMVVQKYLGHASLKITMDTYSHMYPSQLENAVDKIKEFKKKS